MKATELVILIIAATVLLMTLAASVMAADNASFLNINFPSQQSEEPQIGASDGGSVQDDRQYGLFRISETASNDFGRTLSIAIDALT